MASVFKRGKNYFYSITDHAGKRIQRSARTTDKTVAKRIAAKAEADSALRRDRVIDPTVDNINQESKRSIDDHLQDYIAKMQTAGRAKQHINSTRNYIQKISEYAGFEKAVDISAEGVNRYASQLLDQNLSNRTIGAYLVAIKGFTKWLTEGNKLQRDPLKAVKKPNPQTDRRRERRFLLPEEWQWLETVTLQADDYRGISGAERVLLYRTAIETGLRSSELRSLKRGSLIFDSETPCIICKADSTKNKKQARQYIQSKLATSLQQHIVTKAPQASLFKMPSVFSMADMLRDDLSETRKQWLRTSINDPDEYARRAQSDFLNILNHEGEILDFHSLRHTTGSWLSIAGVHPKAIQTVMRHSTITLTMDTYGHLFPGQESETVNKMQVVFPVLPQLEKATGTADIIPISDEKYAPYMHHLGCFSMQNSATQCDETMQGKQLTNIDNTLPNKALRDDMQCDTVPCEDNAPVAQLAEQLTLNQ